MPKTLILMRHAKAVPEGSTPDDHMRALSEIGQADAIVIGKQLLNLRIHPSHALISTALRTRQTLAGVTSHLPIANLNFIDDLYLAAPEHILHQISATENDTQTLLVVGHNPGIADLALALTQPLQRPTISASKFVPATTVVLQWPDDNWQADNAIGKCKLLHILRASNPPQG